MSANIYYLIAASSAVLYGILAVIAKYTKDTVPPFAFIAMTMLLLGTMSLIISLSTERWFGSKTFSTTALYAVAAFAIINLIGFWLYLTGIRGIPVSHYVVLTQITPLVAAVGAYFFLGEAIALRFFIGLPLVALGVWVALSR